MTDTKQFVNAEETLDREEQESFSKKSSAVSRLIQIVQNLNSRLGTDKRSNKAYITQNLFPLLDQTDEPIKEQIRVINQKYQLDIRMEQEDVFFKSSPIEKRIKNNLAKLIAILKQQHRLVDQIGGICDEIWRMTNPTEREAMIKQLSELISKKGWFAESLSKEIDKERNLFQKELKDEHHLYRI